MLGVIVDVTYPDHRERGFRDKEVIDSVESHSGRLCNRSHWAGLRKIRAFFEQKITAEGFVHDMTAGGIDIALNTPGLYVTPEPLNVGKLNTFGTDAEVRAKSATEYNGPCETCGATPEIRGSTRCNQCYEVERYLHTYIESPAGRDFVLEVTGLKKVIGDLSEANRKKKNRIQHQKQHIKRLQAKLTSECPKAGGRDSKSQRVGSIPTGRAEISLDFSEKCGMIEI